MTRFVVDCDVVLHLASEGIEVPAEHELLAPTILRSQTLSELHEAVYSGEITPDVALDRLAPHPGDADPPPRRRRAPAAGLGRRRALGWAETYDAEYVALTQLQADALVTLDAELARGCKGSSRRRRSDAPNGLSLPPVGAAFYVRFTRTIRGADVGRPASGPCDGSGWCCFAPPSSP